ncbi:hypothetical protein MT340_009285 [Staphylococcus sp. NRL 16/872]|uniref:hypothetical protein n=1 Tax=Staphylococcus sp. NRL 16/872 TaxID=2930131 RepID=UPI001FB4DF1E|nr:MULTISPECIES: hypothetical protein [unclassified Staphylococcus]MCJ1656732.1 hypothetical protein [Staphylococcus sp. NRL 21/187]MCJ1662484.1 hypothetical protein [Staphylococcus sp. NRL 18/288]MCJ1668578.1 hypothetical protein [Staphylococcus sp. NRL 19/737]WEN70593.1 hypothetical protein MT340_009285 [Staphylococcus sp. NRL 16/872]
MERSEINKIIYTIEVLLANNTPYSISKNSEVPRQTVTDLKKGNTNIKDARFRTIIKLYNY